MIKFLEEVTLPQHGTRLGYLAHNTLDSYNAHEAKKISGFFIDWTGRKVFEELVTLKTEFNSELPSNLCST